MIKLQFKVLGKDWTLRALKKKKFKEKHGNHVAVTHPIKRYIDLTPKGINKHTITHELVHAHLTEMGIDATDISVEDLEEVFCELMAKHGEDLLKTAEDLFIRLRVEKADLPGDIE